MADTKPQPAPAPKPAPKPKPSVSAQAEQAIAATKTSTIDKILRPFRYTKAFIFGTIGDGLDGFANYGRFGLKWGAVAGLVIGIATGGLGTIAVGVIGATMAAGIGGFVAGAALGGAQGLLMGGMKAVARMRRMDLYADDLVERAKVQKSAPANSSDYRDAYRASQMRKGVIAQQILEREAERKRDENTYWQDREHRGANGWGQSR